MIETIQSVFGLEEIYFNKPEITFQLRFKLRFSLGLS